jgi:putative restriction endonuclease
VPLTDIEGRLTTLLKEFAPGRKSYHPAYPFVRLVGDGIWEVYGADDGQQRLGHTDPQKTELRR